MYQRPTQLGMADLAHMTTAQIVQARKAGQFDSLMAGNDPTAPPQSTI